MSETHTETQEHTEQGDIVDVRALPPAQRHATIFRCFLALPVGDGFILVNDHDPKPLYYQLNFEHPGELGWEYLEQGPEVWRVRIQRAAAAKASAQRRLPVQPSSQTAE